MKPLRPSFEDIGNQCNSTEEICVRFPGLFLAGLEFEILGDLKLKKFVKLAILDLRNFLTMNYFTD